MHPLLMRTRGDVEHDMLDALADEHRCDKADDEVGVAFACDKLRRLGDEWPTIRLTFPEPRVPGC